MYALAHSNFLATKSLNKCSHDFVVVGGELCFDEKLKCFIVLLCKFPIFSSYLVD